MGRGLLIFIYIFLCLSLAARLAGFYSNRNGPVSGNKIAALEGYSRSVRKQLVVVNQRILTEPAASLVSGVLWGEKETFSASAKRALRVVGLSHIVVASGMNLVLLGGLLSLVLRGLHQYRPAVFIFMILIYTFITGFDPPIVRAAVMIITIAVAQLWGRALLFYWPLVLAAYILIFISPQIIELVSFQLSFLAMTGQVVLGYLSERLKVLNSFLIADFAQTVAAQLFTLPILLSNFGNYSPLSIIANVLVLWAVPWLMALGLLAGIVSMFSISIGLVIALPLQPLSFYFWSVVALFSNQDWLLIKFKFSDPLFYLGYYLLLLGITGVFMKKLPVKMNRPK